MALGISPLHGLDSWANHGQTCGEGAFWSPVRDDASPQMAENAIPPSLEMRAEDMQYLKAPKMGTCVDTSIRERLRGPFLEIVPWPSL